MKNVKFINRPIVFEEPELIIDNNAWLGHIPFAFWIVDALRPKNLVELGTHTGSSYCAFAQAVKTLKLDAACFAVDTWQGDPHSGFYGDEVLRDLAAFHDPRYASFSRLIRSTFDDALGHFPDRGIDLLHIDGYHTYEAITHDFNSWLPKLSDRGVMLFHDVNVRERDFGAWRFWDEVKTRYPSFTFLHSHGLGVLAVGKKLPPAVRWLVSQREESPDAISEVRRFFGRLGGLVNEVGARRQLGGQVARLSNEVGASQVQIASLTTDSSTLRAHLAERDQQVRSIESDRQALRDQLMQSQQVASGQEQRIKGLEGEVSVAHAAVSQRETELARTRGELAQRSIQVQQIETEMQSLREQVAQQQTEVAGRDERIKEMGNELAQLRADVALRAERVQALESAHQQVHDQLTQAHVVLSDREQQIKGLDQEMTVVRTVVSERDTELAQARGELAQRSVQIQQIEAEMQSLREQVAQRQTEVAGRDERIKGMEDELVQLRADIAQRAERVQALESAHQQMHDQLTQAHALLNDRDQQIQGLDQEMMVARATVSQLDTELAQARGELAQQITRVQQGEAQTQQLQDQLNQSEVLVATRGRQIEESEQALAAAQVLISRRNTQLTALLQDLAQKDAELSIRKIEAQSADSLATALEEKERDLLDLNTRLSAALEQLSTMQVEMYDRGVTITRLTKTTEDREYRLREIEKRFADAQAELTTLRTSLRERDLQNSSALAAVAEKTKTLRLELERIADAEQQRVMVLGESVKRFLTAEEFAALPVDAMKENAEVEVGRAQVVRQATSGNVISIGDYASVADSAGQSEQPIARRPLLVSSNASVGHSEAVGVQAEIDRARVELTRSEANRVKGEAGSAALRRLLEEQKAEIEKLRCETEEEKKRLAALNERVRERDLELGLLAQLAAEREGNIVNLNHVIAERDRHFATVNTQASEAVACIGEITRSRSWRYTAPLRNLKTRFSNSMPLRFEPLHQLQREPTGGWVARGNDPQFLMRSGPVGESESLSAGVYRIEIPVQMNDGVLVGPCLYIDYGEGISEECRINLPELRDGFIRALLRFPRAVHLIRFDPSNVLCSFALGDSKMVKVSDFLGHLQAFGVLAGKFPPRKWLPLSKDVLNYARANGLASTSHLVFKKLTESASSIHGYEQWIRQYDTLSKNDIDKIHKRIEAKSDWPIISVVMPVYNTDPKWLTEAIESVRQQLYPHWELCIADDASTDSRIRALLERYAQEDKRIKIVFRETNGHISEASNSALSVATGQYVALLDHDDTLAAHALYMVAEEVSANPEADIIYSDEDKIDEHNKRFDPHFKSDWNPDLFYSQNYVSHLGVYRTSLVRELGGFRKGYEGSQDYDLCLRCVAKTKSTHIRHIPHVLYHWRAIAGSTALATGEKNYAETAAHNALSDYFRTANCGATVEIGEGPTTYRVRFPLPDKLPLVSLIIPTRNGFEILKQCIESIRAKTTYLNYEIIIVDNQSDEARTLNYLAELEQQKIARILRYDLPFNFSAINNYAVTHCAGELIGLINNDIEIVSPEWLSEMVSHALRPEVGAVGAKLMYGDGRLQHAGVIVGLGGVAGHSHKYFAGDSYGYFFRLRLLQNLSAVTAACLVVRKSIYQEVGGLEEQNLTIAFNDVDFCLRIRDAGYRNLWTPYALLHHHESVSRGAEDNPEKIARFQREIEFMKKRWGAGLLKDPYYSANLTLDHEDFSIAWPPRVQPPWRVSLSMSETAVSNPSYLENQGSFVHA